MTAVVALNIEQACKETNIPYVKSRQYQHLHTQGTFVVVEDYISTRKIAAGMHQGSPLSPQQYNIYTSNIPTNTTVEVALFGDDTTIIIKDQLKLQNKWMKIIKKNENKL